MESLSHDQWITLAVSGVVGVLTLGAIAKGVVDGYISMRDKVGKSSAVTQDPMVTAVTISWDRDQQERLIQTFEKMATAMESQARSQSHFVDQREQDMQDQIKWLVDEMKKRPPAQPRRRRAKTTGSD